jgi:hypothetical protein
MPACPMTNAPANNPYQPPASAMLAPVAEKPMGMARLALYSGLVSLGMALFSFAMTVSIMQDSREHFPVEMHATIGISTNMAADIIGRICLAAMAILAGVLIRTGRPIGVTLWRGACVGSLLEIAGRLFMFPVFLDFYASYLPHAAWWAAMYFISRPQRQHSRAD